MLLDSLIDVSEYGSTGCCFSAIRTGELQISSSGLIAPLAEAATILQVSITTYGEVTRQTWLYIADLGLKLSTRDAVSSHPWMVQSETETMASNSGGSL